VHNNKSMSKELTPSEAWKLIYKSIEEALKDYETLQDDFNKLYERTYKEHKALEIIKKKNVCIHDLKKLETLKEYNGCREWEEELTQEEYEILKEVLE